MKISQHYLNSYKYYKSYCSYFLRNQTKPLSILYIESFKTTPQKRISG